MSSYRPWDVLKYFVAVPLLIIISGIGLRYHEAAASLENARLAVQAGDHKTAAMQLSIAAEHLPYRGDLWESAGDQAMLAGDESQAFTYYRRAQNLGQLSPDGFTALGKAYLAMGDSEAALKTWQEQLDLFGPTPEVLKVLAESARMDGDLSLAIEHWQSYILLAPADAGAYYQLGVLLAAVQPHLASAPLITARDLEPAYASDINILLDALRPSQFENPPAYIFTRAGQALGAVGEWQLAYHALQTATEDDPTYAEAWAFLGEAKERLGESGQVELEVAWGLNPDSIAANTLLAFYWQRQNDYDQAVFFMQHAAELDPNNPSIQADLGAFYLANGDIISARDHYRQAIDLAPHQAEYWRLLAEFCVENEVFLLEEGLPAAERLASLEPNDPAHFVLLGRVHFLLFDDTQALQAFRIALDIDPDFAPAHLHLALLLLRTREMDEAQHHLTLASDLDPRGDIGAYARRLLTQYFP